MTPASPTWAQVQEFLEADGWRRLEPQERGERRSRHVFYEKTLDDGRVLQTHVSHSGGKTVSPGRFKTILRFQLEVTESDFCECIRTRKPVERPVPVADAPVEHELWVIDVLVRELHFSPPQIVSLSKEDALRIVHEHWSRST